ncbi:glycosyltransferase family 2 protein, partial [Candidatus Gracilibacteria bacterium]|nr:glycosyltransferase family 2 protein [Candidatus Gracilibacteria bacterium]
MAIAQSFQSQTSADFRIVLHRNYGLSQNWNFCISQAKGEYIKFLFQDDFLAPECIEKLVAVARQDSEIGLVFSPRGIAIAETESNPILRKASSAIKDLYKGWSNLKQIQNGQELLADANCLNNPINKLTGTGSCHQKGVISPHSPKDVRIRLTSGLTLQLPLPIGWAIGSNS